MAREATLEKVGASRIVVRALFLMALWLLLSGHYDTFHITLGIVSVALVLVLNHGLYQLDYGTRTKPEWTRVRLVKAILYFPWLSWEIVKASLAVARAVMFPSRVPIEPVLLRFNSRLPSVGADLVLAQSITIMPGTLTIAIREDEFLVHGLNPEAYASLIDGSMSAKIGELFEGTREGALIEDVRIIRSVKDL